MCVFEDSEGKYTMKKIFNRQTRIKQVLDAKGIEYEEIDLSKDQEKRDEMREKAGIPDLLPPALFNDDMYCGDFETFEDAVEDGTLKKIFRIGMKTMYHPSQGAKNQDQKMKDSQVVQKHCYMVLSAACIENNRPFFIKVALYRDF